MANAPNWGFFSDLPGYSGRFNNFHISQEPPIDYDEAIKKPARQRTTSTFSSDRDDGDGDDAEGNAKSLKRVLTRFAERTSMQGVPYILVSKHPLAKLMWVIFLLVAMAAMILHLYYLFTTYYSYQKQTQVLLGFSKLQFPAVTICNMNAVRRSQMMEYGNKELKEFVQSVRPSELVLKMKRRQGGSGHQGGGYPPPPPTSTATDQSPSNTEQSTEGTQPNSQDTQQSSTGTEQSAATATEPSQNQADSGQSQDATTIPMSLNRKKRFVNTLEFNFTNKRNKFEEEETKFNKEHKFFSGTKSSLHGIEDEFLYLLYKHPRSVRREMGHQIENMLVDCSFDGITCSDDDFKLVPSPIYGNCFTLENDLFVVRRNGPSHGLELILFLETQEFLRGISRGNGIVVQVHQPRTWAFPEDDGLYISTYQETNIAMRMKNIERLGQPYGRCETGTHHRNLYNITYTRQTCQSICYSNEMYATCKCYDETDELTQEIGNFSDTDFPKCSTDKEIKCQVTLEQKWTTGSIQCDCPNPCSENSYQRLLSSRNWPSDEYSLLLLESICKERSDSVCETYTKMNHRQLNLNFLKLNIFFEDLNYENITEVPSYENSQFLSDIGGTIGLWIGLSLLSIAEVGQFICEFFHYICYVKFKQDTRRRVKKRWEDAARDTKKKENVVKSFFPDYGNVTVLGRKQNPFADIPSSSISSSRRNISQ